MNDTLALLGGTPTNAAPLPSYDSLGAEERQAAIEVMDSHVLSDFLGRAGKKFLGGSKVQELEDGFIKKFGVKHAVSFNSATTALQAAVAALGIGPGDEVITSPFTMSATPTSVLLNGAVPVFADIDAETYCISAATIAERITPRTKAIIVVNIFGGAADYGPILELAKKHDLKIIEDNAQAAAATYRGTFTATIGDIGVFSFNVHKVIQAGEGGMLVTNNDRLAYRAQLVRNHGEAVMDDVWESEPVTRELIVGSNYRMSELHAAVVIEQLKKLDSLNATRIALANYLTEQLRAFSWLAPASVLPESTHVYYMYPVKFVADKLGVSRKTFAKAIAAEGFPMPEGYHKPLYLFPVYQQRRMYERTQFPFMSSEFPTDVSYAKGICPVVERMYGQELLMTTLCQPPKTKASIGLFVQALKKIESQIDALKAYEAKA